MKIMSWLHNKLFWTVLIFLCAGAFRLTAMDLIEFKLDEARDVYEMGKFWAAPSIIIERGTIQSTGVYNPPLWYYFLAGVSVVSRDPQYLSFVIAFLNCVAVAGFYVFVRKFYGQFVAVSAGLLLAFSPWNILFSRKIWAPDMVLVLAVPLFYFLHVILQGRTLNKVRPLQKWASFFVPFLLSLLSQLHASGIFLSVAVGLTMLLYVILGRSSSDDSRIDSGRARMTINWKYAILGLLVSLIPLLPYISYQARTGCADCKALSTYQQGGALLTPFFDSNAFLRPFQFIGGTSFDGALGTEGYQAFVQAYPFIGTLSFVSFFSFLLLPLGIIYILQKKRELLFLPCMLMLVTLIYFFTQTAGYLYYFLIISPITMLIYTLGIVHLGGVLGKGSATIRGVITITIITVIIVINIIFEFSLYQYLSIVKVVPGDYGPIYSVTKQRAGQKGLPVEEYTISLYQQPQ